MIETKSSTASDEAIGASPGRVTVHCWSKERLEVDCKTMRIIKLHFTCIVQVEVDTHEIRKVHRLAQQRHCRSNNQLCSPHLYLLV